MATISDTTDHFSECRHDGMDEGEHAVAVDATAAILR